MRKPQQGISLDNKLGKLSLKKLPSQKPYMSVNLTKIMNEISQIDDLHTIRNANLNNKSKSDDNRDLSSSIFTNEQSSQYLVNESQLIDSSDNKNQLNASTLNRYSYATGSSTLSIEQSTTSFDNKCRLFESALRKIDLGDFVLHDNVDSYLSQNRQNSYQEYKIPCFTEVGNQYGESYTTKLISNYRAPCTMDLRTVLNRQTQQDEKFVGSNNKRMNKFIYKQWEKDCKRKLGLNNVYEQMNRLLGGNLKPSTREVNGQGQTQQINFLNQSYCEKKQVAFPKSPKSHLKKKASQKDEKLSSYSKNTGSVFKAKKLNRKILIGAVGVPPPQERPTTQFVEFQLSYKKHKTGEKEQIITTQIEENEGKKSYKKSLVDVKTPKLRTLHKCDNQ